ncbi:hypothetical protein CH330_01170 [candidate division WOR-3 bacterium JGI_Cruoil_03_51_56]|uniref:Type I-B CRISPR-associated protein Cas8b/Csh1 n=1 Tax=candidate division WOR-3 bacterium JGI_Cruoil_03_51_56 TaxID=1973747 RepID=A0A235BXX2_UNCW3|nr:MAG: hypothetical protein CH330_01170 [candidate division WOR-3 bacterium JGI_Cruoil_03_51_56]
MIKGILDIGKQLVSSGDTKMFLENLAKPLNRKTDKQGRVQPQYVAVLNFVTKDTPTIEVQLDAVAKEITSRRFLWRGNAYGSSDQDSVTTNTVKYLLSDTLPTLAKRLPENGGGLKTRVQKVVDVFYVEREEGPKKRKNMRVLNTELEFLREAREAVKNNKSKDSRRGKGSRDKTKVTPLDDAVEVMKKYIAQQAGSSSQPASLKDIALYTVSIDGHLVCQDPIYHEYLENSIVKEQFKSAIEGTCHICGKRATLTWNTKTFQSSTLLKLQVVDKLGFASDLAPKLGFAKNYALCENCYRALLAGNAFIRRKLKSHLAGETVFIVPSVHVASAIPVGRLEKWGDYLREKFGAVTSFNGLQAFRLKAMEYADYEKPTGGYTLNFVIGAPQSSAFKAKCVLQDVPPSYLDEIVAKAIEVGELGNCLLGESSAWHLFLGTIYHLIPSPKAKRGGRPVVMNGPVLALLSSIIGKRSVTYEQLIPRFAELGRVYRYQRFDPVTIIRKPKKPEYVELEFCQAMLQCNLLVEYLRRLGILKGGNGMDGHLEKLQLEPKLGDFVREMKYDEPKAALFLLGTLVGEVGIAQYNKGAKNKPILNKVNFQAMAIPKLRRLANDVFERMRQLKLLSSGNETAYGVAKMLLDKHAESWPLTMQENVFYVLSGYAYVTHKVITADKKKKQVAGSGDEPNK